MAEKSDMYYVSVDPSGKLGWKNSTLTYVDTTAHVIEVLTEKAGNDYKAFLRKLGISYIVAATDSMDYSAVLERMCDEISVVIAAAADGSQDTPSLFSAREGLSSNKAVSFELQNAEGKNGGSVWLRYKVRRKDEDDA